VISWNSPPPMRSLASAANSAFGTHVVLDRAAEITPEALRWIWDGHLAIGKLNLLAGSPGTGKSGIAINLAAAVSCGSPECPLPDGSIPPHGHVILLANEDGVGDTIIPRLIAAGANMELVHIVRGTVANGRPRPFCADDCERLGTKIEQLQGVRLVIIDPITQLVTKNGNSNTDVRKALEPLIDLAEKHGFAILGVAHLAKGSQKRSPLERVAGSLAFGALSRIVHLTVRGESEDGDSNERVPALCALVRIKSNIGRDGGGFSYTVRSTSFNVGQQHFKSSFIRWEGRLCGSAKAILDAIENSAGGADGSSALTRAKAFLTEQLQDGPKPAALVQDLAEQAGISRATLRRAREDLGVVVEKLRNGAQASPWMWSQPGRDRPDPLAQGTPLLPGGPIASSIFDRGFQPLDGRFQFAQTMVRPTLSPATAPHHPVIGGVQAGEHHEYLAHHARDEHHKSDHLEHDEQVEHAGRVLHEAEWTDDTEADVDTFLDTDPAVDQGILATLIGECCGARTRLPDLLHADDDALEEIEEAAVRKHVHPGEHATYVRALSRSDWMYM
jgi:hypothetical protein